MLVLSTQNKGQEYQFHNDLKAHRDNCCNEALKHNFFMTKFKVQGHSKFGSEMDECFKFCQSMLFPYMSKKQKPTFF